MPGSEVATSQGSDGAGSVGVSSALNGQCCIGERVCARTVWAKFLPHTSLGKMGREMENRSKCVAGVGSPQDKRDEHKYFF